MERASRTDWEDTIRRVEQAQSDLMPKEDLSPYEGEWVALRDGHLVGHDPDLLSLRNNSDILDDDVFVIVPRAGARIVGVGVRLVEE